MKWRKRGSSIKNQELIFPTMDPGHYQRENYWDLQGERSYQGAQDHKQFFTIRERRHPEVKKKARGSEASCKENNGRKMKQSDRGKNPRKKTTKIGTWRFQRR